MSASSRIEAGDAADPTRIRSRGLGRQSFTRLRREKLTLGALFVLLAIFAAGALAPEIAPYGFGHLDLRPNQELQPPTLAGRHFFGTDDIGHDLFSETLYGVRTSAEIALSVAVLAGLLGTLVGAIAGYCGGWLDSVLMRIVDFVMTLPVLAVLLASIVFAPQMHLTPLVVAVVLTLYMWTSVARVVRVSFAALREVPFVEAARAMGASPARVIVRHMLPNSFGPIIVAATALIGQAILLEATVEYFNYGVSSLLRPSLGNLVADSTKAGLDLAHWWLFALPAVVIVVMIGCANFVADSLDEALNPASARKG